MFNRHADTPLLSALANLQAAVTALDPSKSYADMLPQFESVALALAHAKYKKAALENASKPVFSLPPEITSYIFAIGHDMYDAGMEDNILPSLRISHVSHVWREVAISTPSLWATLCYIPRRSTLFYEMLVERSQASVLDVTIRVKDDNRECELLALALSHSCRWRRLSIVAPFNFVQSAISRLRDVSAPHLEALRIANPTPATRGIAAHPDTKFCRILTGGAGKLSVFSSQFTWQTCCPPLTALTKLSIIESFPMSYPSFCEMLHEASPTLTHLTIMATFEAIPEPIRCVVLPSLLTIEMDIDARQHPDHILMVLVTIAAPSAIQITMFVHKQIPWAERSWLFGSLDATRRYPMLKKLRIYGELGGGILTLFPTIIALVISERRPIVNNIGNLFDPNQNGFSTLVPRLSKVLASSANEGAVRAFSAARLAVGLTAPAFKVLL